MSTAGKAFNAYEFANCEDTLTMGDHQIKVNRKLTKEFVSSVKIREHEGQMFASEWKDEQ